VEIRDRQHRLPLTLALLDREIFDFRLVKLLIDYYPESVSLPDTVTNKLPIQYSLEITLKSMTTNNSNNHSIHVQNISVIFYLAKLYPPGIFHISSNNNNSNNNNNHRHLLILDNVMEQSIRHKTIPILTRYFLRFQPEYNLRLYYELNWQARKTLLCMVLQLQQQIHQEALWILAQHHRTNSTTPTTTTTNNNNHSQGNVSNPPSTSNSLILSPTNQSRKPSLSYLRRMSNNMLTKISSLVSPSNNGETRSASSSPPPLALQSYGCHSTSSGGVGSSAGSGGVLLMNSPLTSHHHHQQQQQQQHYESLSPLSPVHSTPSLPAILHSTQQQQLPPTILTIPSHTIADEENNEIITNINHNSRLNDNTTTGNNPPQLMVKRNSLRSPRKSSFQSIFNTSLTNNNQPPHLAAVTHNNDDGEEYNIYEGGHSPMMSLRSEPTSPRSSQTIATFMRTQPMNSMHHPQTKNNNYYQLFRSNFDTFREVISFL
jgi:hypothetical protein